MRIFFKDNSGVIEITNKLNRYKSDTYLMTMAPSDAIYLASDFPLNHFFVKMGEDANIINANLSVHYYGSQGWAPVVNKNDYTNCFLKSGFIEFTPNKDVPWLMSNTNSNGESVEGLEAFAAGVPLITSRVNGIADYANDSNSIKCELSASSIRESIEKLFKMPEEEKQRMIQNGKETAKKFNWKDIADKMIEELKKL